jgi:tRNA pseudouridine55 synthase
MPEGILSIDKPKGPTSHDVVSRVRRLANTRKVGHGGTLDPLSSGLLILALGRATRLLEYVQSESKTYRALVRLGQTSSTYDGEGKLEDSGAVDVSDEKLLTALSRFRGKIEQAPPMFSAVKREGKPLYELARKGVVVQRERREVTIYELELLSYERPDVTLYIRCSGGTYIRSLAHDLGQFLGCGAYMAGLRRTEVGQLTLQDAVPLQELSASNLPARLQAMDVVVGHLPVLRLPRMEAQRMSQGQWVSGGEGEPDADVVRVYDDAQQFVGIATRAQDGWRPKKIFHEVAS